MKLGLEAKKNTSFGTDMRDRCNRYDDWLKLEMMIDRVHIVHYELKFFTVFFLMLI